MAKMAHETRGLARVQKLVLRQEDRDPKNGVTIEVDVLGNPDRCDLGIAQLLTNDPLDNRLHNFFMPRVLR